MSEFDRYAQTVLRALPIRPGVLREAIQLEFALTMTATGQETGMRVSAIFYQGREVWRENTGVPREQIKELLVDAVVASIH